MLKWLMQVVKERNARRRAKGKIWALGAISRRGLHDIEAEILDELATTTGHRPWLEGAMEAIAEARSASPDQRGQALSNPPCRARQSAAAASRASMIATTSAKRAAEAG